MWAALQGLAAVNVCGIWRATWWCWSVRRSCRLGRLVRFGSLRSTGAVAGGFFADVPGAAGLEGLTRVVTGSVIDGERLLFRACAAGLGVPAAPCRRAPDSCEACCGQLRCRSPPQALIPGGHSRCSCLTVVLQKGKIQGRPRDRIGRAALYGPVYGMGGTRCPSPSRSVRWTAGSGDEIAAGSLAGTATGTVGQHGCQRSFVGSYGCVRDGRDRYPRPSRSVRWAAGSGDVLAAGSLAGTATGTGGQQGCRRSFVVPIGRVRVGRDDMNVRAISFGALDCGLGRRCRRGLVGRHCFGDCGATELPTQLRWAFK